MIVQYNTPEFDHNYGPYPYKMGEEPEEVTDEASKVTILDPTNPVFSWPNQISEADFRGWIEERGSKFMTSWDRRYKALLETHDPSQAPQRVACCMQDSERAHTSTMRMPFIGSCPKAFQARIG